MPSASSSYRDFDNSGPYALDTPASIVRDPAVSARSSLPLSAISGAEKEKVHGSRFMEDVSVPTRQSAKLADTPSGKTIAASSSPTVIDPASIPTRTSSSRATSNGGEKTTSPRSPKTPRKHRGLSLFPSESKRRPEVSENSWIAANKASLSSPESTRSQSYGILVSQARTSMEPAQAVGQDLIHGDGFSWSAEKENIVKGPFDYLESHPGKDIRTQLINAFNLWLQVPEPSLAIINRVIGMLHSASLLIDDVEDNSNLRRGVPVAHSIFGVAQTINSANYVYFCALQELTKLNNPEAIQIYTDELLSLHRGQGMDLFWRDTLTCPSEDDYLEMVGNKTGGLFRLAIKLMCAESPSHHFQTPRPESSTAKPDLRQQADYVPLVNTIGLLFQILDDYRNLSDTTYTANKGLCEDLTEGKFSFPIIHAIRANPANLVLINILKQKPTDDEVKRYAVAYMEKTGSFSYTRRVLRGLTKKALALVDEVDAGRGMGEGVGMILEKLKVDKGKDAKEAKDAKAAAAA